jgi:hypothetical protein
MSALGHKRTSIAALHESAMGQNGLAKKKRDRVAAVSPRMATDAFRPVDLGIQTGPYRNQG